MMAAHSPKAKDAASGGIQIKVTGIVVFKTYLRVSCLAPT